MDQRTLTELLKRVAGGDVTVEAAVEDLRHLPTDYPSDDLRIDTARQLRTGQPEAVYGPGKTPDQVRHAVKSLLAHSTGAVFVTRATRDQFEAAHEEAPDAVFHERSGLVVAKPADEGARAEGAVAVVSAGTSDGPVAEEAEASAAAMGLTVERFGDVGVAGIHRVLEVRDAFERADCLIVVAGMEAALASVITGLTSRPVVAVPTSVGYGASFEGMTALLGMLASCAPGVSVVNIDNGFGAAMVADRICRAARED